MRKIMALLLCFCLLSVGPVTAFAQEAVHEEETGGNTNISVTVPDSHKITISAEHAQVLYHGQMGENFSVERLSEPTFLIRPENGYKVARVLLNGEDVTAQVRGGYYTLESVYEEKTMTVETEALPLNSESTHVISGNITDKDGNPVSGATVDIGGHTGVTDENGDFTISDVPDGYHPVAVTDKDGNLIGYTEIEISEGDLAMIQNQDGSYSLTATKNAELRLELTITTDGRISVDDAADITKQPGDETMPQTGDTGSALLWTALLLCSGALLLFTGALYRKKQTM